MKRQKKCSNCESITHDFNKCLLPVLSMGIILFNEKEELLMIQRRNTMAFIDIIRGRLPNFHHMNFDDRLSISLGEVTSSELSMLLNNSFDDLWEFLWGESRYKRQREFHHAKKRFYCTRNNIIKLTGNSLICGNYSSPEFSFPKGRRNSGESLKSCATREFEEETGYTKNDYQLIDGVSFEELYMGTNGIEYKHVYYLAKYINEPSSDISSSDEVAFAKFFKREKLFSIFRPYEKSKIELVNNVYKHLYSNNFYKN